MYVAENLNYVFQVNDVNMASVCPVGIRISRRSTRD